MLGQRPRQRRAAVAALHVRTSSGGGGAASARPDRRAGALERHRLRGPHPRTLAADAPPDAALRPGQTLGGPRFGVLPQPAAARRAPCRHRALAADRPTVSQLVAQRDRRSEKADRHSVDARRRSDPRRDRRRTADSETVAVRTHRPEQGLARRQQPHEGVTDRRRGAGAAGPRRYRRGDPAHHGRGHPAGLVVPPARPANSVRQLRTGLRREHLVLVPGAGGFALCLPGGAVRHRAEAADRRHLPKRLAGHDGPELLRPSGLHRRRTGQGAVAGRNGPEHGGDGASRKPGVRPHRKAESPAGRLRAAATTGVRTAASTVRNDGTPPCGCTPNARSDSR